MTEGLLKKRIRAVLTLELTKFDGSTFRADIAERDANKKVLKIVNEAKKEFPCHDWSPKIWQKMKMDNYPFWLAMRWFAKWFGEPE